MAHQIYLTEGIILKKKDFGEADRLFWIYTEKFGMIMAIGKSVRLEKSKLRYNLELYSYGEFALIASKEFWRIVDASEILTPKVGKNTKLKLAQFSKTARLLLRMIKGQEANDFVWLELKTFFLLLFGGNTKEIRGAEVLTIARIMNNLGYMEKVPNRQNLAVQAINKAIRESML